MGIWVLLGAFFLSATGITCSTYGGANVSELRTALNWGAPSVNTDLTASGDSSADEHAHHHAAAAAPTGESVNTAAFDTMLSIGQEVNVNTGLAEIKPPAAKGQAWVVQEIQRSYPTEVDAVSINGQTLQVVDRVDFKDFSLAAKLSRWGIEIHMGSMFELPNQILLFLVASTIAAMVVLGYAMWWKRRPTKNPTRRMGKAPARGGLLRAPWWAALLVLAAAVLVGLFLPLKWPTSCAEVAYFYLITHKKPVIGDVCIVRTALGSERRVDRSGVFEQVHPDHFVVLHGDPHGDIRVKWAPRRGSDMVEAGEDDGLLTVNHDGINFDNALAGLERRPQIAEVWCYLLCP